MTQSQHSRLLHCKYTKGVFFVVWCLLVSVYLETHHQDKLALRCLVTAYLLQHGMSLSYYKLSYYKQGKACTDNGSERLILSCCLVLVLPWSSLPAYVLPFLMLSFLALSLLCDCHFHWLVIALPS